MLKKPINIALIALSMMSCNVNELHYDDFKSHQITFKNIFLEKKDHLVYFYEETCSHCKKIKQEVLTFFKETKWLFYLVEDMPINQIDTHYQKSIGASKSEDVLIPGFPTMIYIENQKVSQFYIGTSEIQKWLRQIKE